MKYYRRNGFTLIELMIVVVIIGLLAALAIPRYLSASKKAKIGEARIVLKALWTCAQTYYAGTGCWPTVSSTRWVNAGWPEIDFDAPAGKTRFCYAYTNSDPVGADGDFIASATGGEHIAIVPTQHPDASLEAVRVRLSRCGIIKVSLDYGATFIN